MTTGERLVDISTLTTGTAMDHFLNISTGGEISYLVQSILEGKAQKITKLNGELQKIDLLDGVVKKKITLSGEVVKIIPLEGNLSKKTNLKGDIKCQQ